MACCDYDLYFHCLEDRWPQTWKATCAGLTFLALSGIWPETMLSVYLCGIAVIVSFILGSGLGIWSKQRYGFRDFTTYKRYTPDNAIVCYFNPFCNDI